MATHIVGVGDMAVSKAPGDVLRTFALGSCVGVVIVDPVSLVTGMLHLVLPDGTQHGERAQKNPAYFADTGIATLIESIEKLAGKHNRRWVCKIAGGAKVLNQTGTDTMDIGKRNVLATKKYLWKFGLGPLAEDVGLTHSRTVSVTVGDTKLLIQNRQVGDVTI
jgi:chemotaxis protein CheD